MSLFPLLWIGAAALVFAVLLGIGLWWSDRQKEDRAMRADLEADEKAYRRNMAVLAAKARNLAAEIRRNEFPRKSER